MSPPDWLTRLPIAHRGLHDAARGIIENSMSAFEAAAAAGYAIELDLRLSRDGKPMVFHDVLLTRLTGVEGALSTHDAEKLTQLTLGAGPDRIPALDEVLGFVNGRVPLLIELKAEGHDVVPLAQTTVATLAPYRGAFAVQSFNPYMLRWFRDHAPKVVRGLLSGAYRKSESAGLSTLKRFTLRHLLTAPLLAPQFIGYDVCALPALAPGLARRFHIPVIAWTVRDETTRKIATTHADNIIFEGFRPILR